MLQNIDKIYLGESSIDRNYLGDSLMFGGDIPMQTVNFLSFSDGSSTDRVDVVNSASSGYSYKVYNQWTDEQKGLAKGQKMLVEFDVIFNDVQFNNITGHALIGFNFDILHEDGTKTDVSVYLRKTDIVTAVDTPSTGVKKVSKEITIQNKNISNFDITNIYLTRPQSGEMYLENIGWMIEIPI